MRARLSYLRWKLRGRGYVRLHCASSSFEGLFLGCHGAHYLLFKPLLLDEQGGRHELGGEIEVPRERVLFVQHLVAVERSLPDVAGG